MGATAVGKSTLALAVAERLGGEIVNADATLLYQGLDLGAARPEPAELARITHHLVGVCGPRETVDVVTYQGLAYAAIDDVLERGSLPLLVGGSGLYVRAVVDGYVFPPVAPDPSLRAALEAEAETLGPEALHARLRTIDPAAAERTHPNNVRRVVRAREVHQQTGRPLSEFHDARAPRYETRVVGLRRDRAELYARIDARVEGMFAAGLVGEVEGLLAAGVPAEAPALRAIGYKEVVPHLVSGTPLGETMDAVKRSTRKLARQQVTSWFRDDDPGIVWIDADAPDAVDRVVRVLDPEGEGTSGD